MAAGRRNASPSRKRWIPDEFEIVRGLTQESSVIISGAVRADDRAPGFPGGYEIGIQKLELVQEAQEYPITVRKSMAPNS